MKAVIQRVTRAKVSVDGQIVGAIDRGLLVLAGVQRGDQESDADWLADKIANLRIFSIDGRFAAAAGQIGGAILLVSQFTLLASTRKGRRPDFLNAAEPTLAASLIDRLGAKITEQGLPLATGRFGAMMEVELVNDGPVTILLDSRERQSTKDQVRGS